MATPDELRASLDEARQNFRSALEGVQGNGAWEREPETGDGEEAWSARQAAEHAIASEVYFAKAVCDACGYPGPEIQQVSAATPEEALTAFEDAVEKSHSKIKYVTEEDLTKPHERMQNVETILNTAIWHLNDHADQIRVATA